MYRPVLYTKVNSLQRRDAEDFIDEYNKEVGSMSGCCIDIGSGPGDVMVDIVLPRLAPNSTVTCSDVSEVMSDYEKKRYGDNDRLSFIKLDIGNPDLPKHLVGQFDHATSFYCINWCRDLSQALKNIHSLLQPGGTAFISFVASCPALDSFKVLQAMPKYQIYMKETRRITPVFQHVERPRQTAMTLLNDAGFEVQNCSYRAMSYIFDTVDYFKQFLIALSPHETHQMPTDVHGEYERDLISEALKRDIVFNKDRDGKNGYSVLFRYCVFVTYLKKPLTN